MNTRTATRTFAALMLTLGVAGAYAQQEHGHVKMTLSGTNVATTIIGTESTYYYARAQGVPADKLIVVRGGEDYAFERLSVRGDSQPAWRSSAGAQPPDRSQRVAAACHIPARCQTSVSHGRFVDRRGNTGVSGTRGRASSSGVRVHELHRARNRRASARCRADWSDAGATRGLSYTARLLRASGNPRIVLRHTGIASTSPTMLRRTPPLSGCKRFLRK